MSGQYSFPLLPDKDIGQCLHELGLSVSLELLAKPTFEFVQPLYEHLVTVLMGVSREELQQPVFAAIDALEFPELHDESIPAISFLRHLGRLMIASGIRDFSVKDLYKPEQPRLRRNLSAVINFAKYREEKLLAYTELQEHLEALVADKEALEAEQADLRAERQRLQDECAAEMPEVALLESEQQDLFAENQQLNKQQNALASEVRTLKQQTNAVTDEASQLRYRLSQARGQQELLRSQIVQSPQKVQAMLEELSAAVERERGLVAEADRRLRDLHARLEVIAKVEKEVQKAIGLMDAVDVEINKKKEVSRKVKALKAEIAANEHEVLQLVATQNHLKRQQGSLLERIERLEKQCTMKREAAESSIEQQLRDKEAIEAENAAALAKIAQNEAMMRALREKVQQLQKAHDGQIQSVMEQFNELRHQVADYHQRMESAMKGHSDAPQAAVKPMKVR